MSVRFHVLLREIQIIYIYWWWKRGGEFEFASRTMFRYIANVKYLRD